MKKLTKEFNKIFDSKRLMLLGIVLLIVSGVVTTFIINKHPEYDDNFYNITVIVFTYVISFGVFSYITITLHLNKNRYSSTKNIIMILFKLILANIFAFIVSAILLISFFQYGVNLITFLFTGWTNLLLGVLLGIVLFIFYNFYEKQKEKEINLIRLEEEKTRAELLSLHARINPHFLFNSLNSIASLVYSDQEATENMIENLSELMRYTLNSAKKEQVTIKEEIDIVKKYLYIEKIRFNERLNFSITIDKDTENFLIPPLLIQPIIENSIKHCISKFRDGGTITVNSIIKNGLLEISITDAGKKSSTKLSNIGTVTGTGFGFEYIEKRLKIMYSDKFTIKRKQNQDGFKVKIEILIRNK